MSNMIVSPNPHIHSKDSTKSLMLDVVIALIPAVICSVIFYVDSSHHLKGYISRKRMFAMYRKIVHDLSQD